MVDRDVVGGICHQVLGNLGSVSLIYAIINNTQLLDPYMVVATFYAGSTFLLFFASPGPYGFADPKYKEARRKNSRFLAGCVCLFLTLLLLTFIVPTFIVPVPKSVVFESLIVVIRFALIGLALAILAALILGLLMVWYSKRWPDDRIVVRGLFLVLFAGVTACLCPTLWWPIGTSTLVKHVETFEPRTAGYWSNWQVTARWLQDQGIDYDQSAVQARWLDAWEKDERHRLSLLNDVVSTGLRVPELNEAIKSSKAAKLMLSAKSAGTPIYKFDRYGYIIAVLVEEGSLTNEQRDHLAGRLLATWRTLNDDRVLMDDAAIITNLLSLIDRPLAEAERKADVVRWLGEYQALDNGPFADYGGFKRYSKVNSSELMSTESAVRLMQHYGTHDSVDVLALRAFLRPAMSDRFMIERGSVRASIRQRLDQIPGIPQPTLWDYFRLNQSLWFAVLLVGLCVYATLGSPRILKEDPGEPAPPVEAS